MGKLLLCLTATLVLTGLCDARQTEPGQNDNLRTWTDITGTHTTEAELVSWDPETKQVVLQTADNGTIELNSADLHISDRRFLNRHAARMRREARNSESDGNIFERSRVSKAQTRNNDVPLLELGGIPWHQSADQASIAASGREGAKDDKPIVWFRVLGDLSGYM